MTRNVHKKDSHNELKVLNVNRYATELENIILQLAPESRERTLALEKLEEVVMWASKAVSYK